MTQPSDRMKQCAAGLMDFLTMLPDGPLPRMAEIAKQLPGGPWEAYNVAMAMEALSTQRRIAMRHGTRSAHRGHYALRIVLTGRELKTEGCPFEPPGRVSHVHS